MRGLAGHLLRGWPPTYEAQIGKVAEAFQCPPWEVEQQDEAAVTAVMQAMGAARVVERFNRKEALTEPEGELLQTMLDALDDWADEQGEPEED